MNKVMHTVLLLILTINLAELKTATEILQEIKSAYSTTEEIATNKSEPTTESTSTQTETNELPNIKIEQRLIETKNKNYNQIALDKPSNTIEETIETSKEDDDAGPVPCTCGVFLSGQFKKGSKEPPKGVPALTQEMDTPFMNNAMGNRQCTTKCLELIVKHLPKSSDIICAMADRENIFKERAYLFIKNYSNKWFKTNMSAGREFCCKNNEPYKCPI